MIEVRFPDDISYGASAGPKYCTTLVENLSGKVKAIQTWKNPIRIYDVAFGVREEHQKEELQDFWDEVAGRAGVFRFRDFSDFRITRENCEFNGSVGYNGAESFKIYKSRRLKSLAKRYRRIHKIVEDTFFLYKNDLPFTGYNLDLDNGVVNFTPLNTKSIVSITKASNGVITTSVAHGLVNNDMVSFKDVSGMGQINGVVGKVTVINTTSFSINVNTSSYNDYVTGGTVNKYMNIGDEFTYECEFDVPVRFGSDEMPLVANNYEIYSWDSIKLIEERLPI